MARILKPEYQAIADEYEELKSVRGCSCHISPPCSLCTHEGHPISLENTDEAWDEVEDK